MSMIVQQDGREVEIPLEVEAKGGAAIEAYVAEQLGKPVPARRKQQPTTPTAGGDS